MRNQLFNRKVFFSLLAVVMFLGLTAMSYGQVIVSVEPAEVESPAAGEELMVNINIAGGAGVAGYELVVNFDPTALSYVSGGNADYLPAGAFAVPAVVSDNSVKLAAAAIGAVSDGDGTLAMVTFAVVEAKASAISLTDVIIVGADGALDATTADGMVTVAAAEEVTEETTEETTEEVTEETTEETTEEVTEETTEETTEEVTEETTEETTEEVTEETTEETTEEVTEETTEETTEEVTEETTEETTEEVTEKPLKNYRRNH